MSWQNQEAASGSREQQAEPSTAAAEEQTESVFEQLFTAVVTATDGGRVLCQPFKVLPCRTVCSIAFYSDPKNSLNFDNIIKITNTF